MRRQPFWAHIEDLRKVLIHSGWVLALSTLVLFFFRKKVLSFLIAPLNAGQLYIFSPLEGFIGSLKMSFWGALLLSSPIWFYFLMRFLSPALHPREKKFIFPFFNLSFFFMLTGLVFAYKLTLPLLGSFFLHFNGELGQNMWSLGATLNLIIGLLVAHALVFEIYVILLFMIHFRLVNFLFLKKIRREVVVATFVLAAIATPPDVFSQILLALPMLLLYESTLIYAKLCKIKDLSSAKQMK